MVQQATHDKNKNNNGLESKNDGNDSMTKNRTIGKGVDNLTSKQNNDQMIDHTPPGSYDSTTQAKNDKNENEAIEKVDNNGNNKTSHGGNDLLLTKTNVELLSHDSDDGNKKQQTSRRGSNKQ